MVRLVADEVRAAMHVRGMWSLTDLAKATDLHRVTCWRALHGSEGVGESTARVIELALGLGR